VPHQAPTAEPPDVGVQARDRHAGSWHVGADLDRVSRVRDPLDELRRGRAQRLDDRSPLLVTAGREDVVGVLPGRVLDAGRPLEAGAAGRQGATGDGGVAALPGRLLEDRDDEVLVERGAQRGHQAGRPAAGDGDVDCVLGGAIGCDIGCDIGGAHARDAGTP
jgi:hypothetical protein